MTVFQPKEEESQRRKRVRGKKPWRIDFNCILPPLNSLIHIIQSTTFFGHAVLSPSSPFLSPIVFSNPLSPIPASNSGQHLCPSLLAAGHGLKLQKNIYFKTNRPLWNNLVGKAENMNQAGKTWQ